MLKLPQIDKIEIFGYTKKPGFKSVKVNDGAIDSITVDYSEEKKILTISETKNGLIQLNEHLDKWTLMWSDNEDNSASKPFSGILYWIMIAIFVIVNF